MILRLQRQCDSKVYTAWPAGACCLCQAQNGVWQPNRLLFFQFYFHLSLPSFCLFVLLPPILSHSVMPFISGIITFSFDPHTPSPFLLSFNVYNRLSPLLIFTTFSCNKSGLPFPLHSPFKFQDNRFDLIMLLPVCS